MCAIIPVADLRFETFELLEEESFDRLATRRRATQIEYGWELDATETPDLDQIHPSKEQSRTVAQLFSSASETNGTIVQH